RVLVGCRRREKGLRIDVYDTGVGIPHSKRKAVFKEFHRLDQGAKIARGLGLGLSIVERIARILDHKVEVRSQPRRGSHFSVEVPRASAAAGDTRPREPRRSDPGQLADMAVLCIDNDAQILEGMESLLGGWGCSVGTAADLKSAEALLDEGKLVPQGLLVDYHLDDGNGIDIIMRLRERFASD